MRFILVSVYLLLFNSAQADDSQWVVLGSSKINWGYITPYELQLQSPVGLHNIKDIRAGMQTVRFRLKWLSPATSQEDVSAHFKHLIETHLSDPEAIKFNQITINKLLTKLPPTQRNDVWYFVFSPDLGTELIIADQLHYKLIGAEVNRALYHAWLNDNPVTTALLLKRLNRHNQQKQ